MSSSTCVIISRMTAWAWGPRSSSLSRSGTTCHSGRLELFEYLHPEALETTPTLPHEIGMHRVALRVDDPDAALAIAARHGCHPLRGVATYGDVYQLTYLRGPSGILVMLAEERGGGRAVLTAAPRTPARLSPVRATSRAPVRAGWRCR